MAQHEYFDPVEVLPRADDRKGVRTEVIPAMICLGPNDVVDRGREGARFDDTNSCEEHWIELAKRRLVGEVYDYFSRLSPPICADHMTVDVFLISHRVFPKRSVERTTSTVERGAHEVFDFTKLWYRHGSLSDANASSERCVAVGPFARLIECLEAVGVRQLRP